MIDNKTPRLQLPKPDPDNYLDDDVVRLQQAFDILDSAATVGDDGKIHDEQIPTAIARRDSPTFTGIPKSPTALADDSSTQIANTKFVADAVSKAKSDISGDVPDDLSTLEKLALAIANNPEFAQAVSEAIASRAMKGENSDITSLSGLTTPLSTQQGGTGSNSPFGTTAGKFCQGNDSRLGTIDGKSGGKISSSISVKGESAVWIDAPSNPSIGEYLNAPVQKSRLNGRGANLDPLGGYAGMYIQEYVGNYYSCIFNLNAGGSDLSWTMRQGGGTFSPLGQLATSGSDIRLKNNVEPALPGAGLRIDRLKPVEFTWIGLGRRSRGWIAQQAADVDPIYVFEGGEGVDENGEKFQVLNVDQNAIIADLIAVSQELRSQVSDMKNEILELKKLIS